MKGQRSGGLSRREPEQPGKKMGTVRATHQKHIGLPTISAGPCTRSRGLAIIDERRTEEVNAVTVNVLLFQPGFMWLREAK